MVAVYLKNLPFSAAAAAHETETGSRDFRV